MNHLVRSSLVGVLWFLAALAFSNAEAAETGKIFIKAAGPDAEGFGHPRLEDTVKDMKQSPGDFVVVEKEEEAEYLLTVVSREEWPRVGTTTAKRVTATLSVRVEGAWHPGINISRVGGYWAVCAGRVMSEAGKWVKDRAVK
jgi:hypothetical protein